MKRLLLLCLPLIMIRAALPGEETETPAAQTAHPTIRISVNAAAWIRTIPQTLYGANLTAWDGQSGQDAFFNNLMIASGRTDMRWPGGSWGDAFLWSDMEGPNRRNPWIASYSETQTLLARIGGRMQPIVNFPGVWYGVNHGHEAAVAAAVAWVRDQMGRDPTAEYWEIGNEIMGPWEEGWQEGVTTGSFYGERFADFYLAMKAENPAIRIGAVADQIDGPDWWNPGLWTRGMLTAAYARGVVPDFLIIHTYPGSYRGAEYNPTLLGPDIDQIAIDTKTLDRIITETIGQEYVGKIGYWMTEFRAGGINYSDGDEEADEAAEIYPRDRLYCGALFLPQYILEMARHGWQGSNAFGEFYYTAFNRLPPGASYPAPLQPFPDWYLYPFLTRYFGREMVVAESSEPLVRVYASRDEQEALTIFIANNSPDRDFTARTDIRGMTAGADGRSWLIEPAGLTLTGEEGPLQDLNGLSINGVFRPDPLKLDQLPVGTFAAGAGFDVEVLRSRMLLLRIPAAVPDVPDGTPPSAAPARWRKLPHATGSQSIAMEAVPVEDPSGVQYFFDCIDGAGHDSGWQESPFYEDTGLTTGAECTYVLRVRDMSKNRNESPESPPASAAPVAVEIPITLENGGFEQPGSGKQTDWERVPGWSSDSPASGSGVDQAFPTEGTWNGYLTGSDPSVWNLTDYVIRAGDVIELTFDARDYYDGWTRFRAALFWENDGVRTPITSRDITMVRLFRTYTLSFDASDHPQSVGRRLGIEFDTTREGTVSIDRVQLHVRHQPGRRPIPIRRRSD